MLKDAFKFDVAVIFVIVCIGIFVVILIEHLKLDNMSYNDDDNADIGVIRKMPKVYIIGSFKADSDIAIKIMALRERYEVIVTDSVDNIPAENADEDTISTTLFIKDVEPPKYTGVGRFDASDLISFTSVMSQPMMINNYHDYGVKVGDFTKRSKHSGKRIDVQSRSTIGRNDMCSCGSNIKYKNCCLKK